MSHEHSKLAAALREKIRAANRLHRRYLDDPAFFQLYERFIDVQLAYLLPRYDDLRDEPGYDAAIDFIVSDLLGTGTASRDRDLERVAGIMSRTLPSKALEALVLAMDLNARVLAINVEIATALSSQLQGGDPISEKDYCLASRQAATFAEAETLIAMTRDAGIALDRFAHLPLIRGIAHSMRIPARLAGFSDLQAFLEKGLDTFLGLEDVGEFLDALEDRMTEVFHRVFEADPGILETTPVEERRHPPMPRWRKPA
jgi:hypothetical protein